MSAASSMPVSVRSFSESLDPVLADNGDATSPSSRKIKRKRSEDDTEPIAGPSRLTLSAYTSSNGVAPSDLHDLKQGSSRKVRTRFSACRMKN